MVKKQLVFIFLFFFTNILCHAQIITTIAGTPGNFGYGGDGGFATNANFAAPSGLVLDLAGNLYVSDLITNRIRKVNASTGIITTIAGIGTAGFSGDGGLAINAELNNPKDLCLDALGNIYFTDVQNQRVRKVDMTTGVISTIIGNNVGPTSPYYSGEVILATNANINRPYSLTIQGNNLYVSLSDLRRICKLDLLTGILYPIAGNGLNGFLGDGGSALNASFTTIGGLSISSSGELLITDCGNYRVRKINTAGIITTVAGNGIPGYSGDGGFATNASINFATGVFVDAFNNIFITDEGNNVVRKVSSSTGFISTLSGSGNIGFFGDGYPANSPCVRFNSPTSLNVDAFGNVFIADRDNYCVRKIDTSPLPASWPTININTSTTAVCSGSLVNFNALVTNSGISPIYKWRKNGTIVGTNASSYSSTSLINGDIITCELVSSVACGSLTIISNNITILVSNTLIPSIAISTNTPIICQSNQPVSFTAITTNEGNAPLYQWKLNGINVGANANTFTTTNLNNGDIVSCVLTSNATCVTNPISVSNNISVTINASPTPSFFVTTSNNNVCPNTPITFTATPSNIGTTAIYQWQLNGNNVGTNNPVYFNNNLGNGDVINCTLNTINICTSMPVVLNSYVNMIVKPKPVITFNPAMPTILIGNSVRLNASVSVNVATYLWTPSTDLNLSSIPNPIANPLKTTTYNLKVTSTDNCVGDSNITIKILTNTFIPNSFSPNGDNVNDVFRIPPTSDLHNLQYFIIYNRYGNKIFETTDLAKGWNGTFKGTMSGIGVYTFIIKAFDSKGEVLLKGTVLLVR